MAQRKCPFFRMTPPRPSTRESKSRSIAFILRCSAGSLRASWKSGAPELLLQLLDEVCLNGRMRHIRRAGIHELARDAFRFQRFLKFHAEVCRVRRILLRLPHRGRCVVEEVNRRVVGSDECVRRILRDPRQDFPAIGEEVFERSEPLFRVADEAECVLP